MTKTLNEVEVLRWFEEGPIEKTEVVFRIVSEKMRERLDAQRDGGSRPQTGVARKRKPPQSTESAAQDPARLDERGA